MDSMDISISVIIPTYNRSTILKGAIESIVNQPVRPGDFEIIIIDNGSTDATYQVVKAFQDGFPSHNIAYYHEPNPGLHAGRHRGAKEARSDILVFIDDDVVVCPTWLEGIRNGFKDGATGIIGGPSWPNFEVSPPNWFSVFASYNSGKLTCGPLSLIDLGNKPRIVSPECVWGLNFSIRKQLLLDLGGFHPDSVPKSLIRFRGDGETGLAFKAKASGVKSVYLPDVKVIHNIPAHRLTESYFTERFYNQGISDSFTAIRKNRGLQGLGLEHYIKGEKLFHSTDSSKDDVALQAQRAYANGFLNHYNAVLHDANLLKWVLLPDYFDASVNKFRSVKPLTQIDQAIQPQALGLSEEPSRISKKEYNQDKMLLEAQKRYEESRFIEALQILERLTNHKRPTPGANYQKAVVLMNLGRLNAALRAAKDEESLVNEADRVRSLIRLIKELRPYESILRIPTHMKVDERLCLLELAEKVGTGSVILEIGSYLGASSCFLAEGSKSSGACVFCVDTWMNDAMSDGRKDTMAEFLANTKTYSNSIVPLRGNSEEIARSFIKPIDLLFIDGDHSYDACRQDIINWYPKLNQGAYVIFHDYGWSQDIQKAVRKYSQPQEIDRGTRLNTIYWSRVGRKP